MFSVSTFQSCWVFEFCSASWISCSIWRKHTSCWRRWLWMVVSLRQARPTSSLQYNFLTKHHRIKSYLQSTPNSVCTMYLCKFCFSKTIYTYFLVVMELSSPPLFNRLVLWKHCHLSIFFCTTPFYVHLQRMFISGWDYWIFLYAYYIQMAAGQPPFLGSLTAVNIPL